jgi:hypothetical protein
VHAVWTLQQQQLKWTVTVMATPLVVHSVTFYVHCITPAIPRDPIITLAKDCATFVILMSPLPDLREQGNEDKE